MLPFCLLAHWKSSATLNGTYPEMNASIAPVSTGTWCGGQVQVVEADRSQDRLGSE